MARISGTVRRIEFVNVRPTCRSLTRPAREKKFSRSVVNTSSLAIYNAFEERISTLPETIKALPK